MRGQTAWRYLRFPPVKAGLECSSTERGGGLNTDPLAWHWVTEQPFSKVTLGVRLTPAAVWSQNDRSYKRRQVVHEVSDKKCLMVLSLDGWYQTRVFWGIRYVEMQRVFYTWMYEGLGRCHGASWFPRRWNLSEVFCDSSHLVPNESYQKKDASVLIRLELVN